MTDEPEKSAESANLTQDATVELRLRVLEKTENRTFDVVKVGLGIFVLIAGVNWYSAKTNYDRERENFQTRFGLFEKETASSNKEQMGEIKKQSEMYLAAISNNLQNAFVSLQQQQDAKMMNVMAYMTNGFSLMGSNFDYGTRTTFTNIDKNLQTNTSILNVAITNQFNEINKVLQTHREILDAAITNLQAQVDKASAGAVGQSAMVQGSSLLHIQSPSKVINLARATDSLLDATHALFLAKDEMNMRRCLSTIRTKCLQQLVVKSSKKVLAIVEAQEHVGESIQRVISDLEAANNSGRYNDDISSLKLYLDIVQGRVSAK